VAARRLSAAIQSDRRQVAARLRASPVLPTFVDVGGFNTIGPRSLLGSIVDAAKGKDVAGATPEQGPFPLDRLASLDPQAYVALSAAARRWPSCARTSRRRSSRRSAPVASGSSPAASPSRPGVGKALLAVARILHPDAFH
jgi:hypothetical protein